MKKTLTKAGRMHSGVPPCYRNKNSNGRHVYEEPHTSDRVMSIHHCRNITHLKDAETATNLAGSASTSKYRTRTNKQSYKGLTHFKAIKISYYPNGITCVRSSEIILRPVHRFMEASQLKRRILMRMFTNTQREHIPTQWT